MTKIPLSLKHDTILECVFEIRFGAKEASAADLLPGVLFSKFPGKFQKVTPLPLSQMPRTIRIQAPELVYQPLHALEGSGMRVLVGDRSVGLSIHRPYIGWPNFKPQITELVSGLLETSLVGDVERFSLKYTNLVKGSNEFDLSPLTIGVRMGELKPNPQGLAVKAEFSLNNCVTIVQIATGVTIAIKAPSVDFESNGVLVDVDTICAGPFDNLSAQFPQLLERTHDTEKEVFFSVLTPAYVDSLEPVWDAKNPKGN